MAEALCPASIHLGFISYWSSATFGSDVAANWTRLFNTAAETEQSRNVVGRDCLSTGDDLARNRHMRIEHRETRTDLRIASCARAKGGRSRGA
jgi:hypothetical protein